MRKIVTLNIVAGMASHGEIREHEFGIAGSEQSGNWRKAGAGGGCVEKEPGGGHDHVLMLCDGFSLSELEFRLIEELKNKKKNEKAGHTAG